MSLSEYWHAASSKLEDVYDSALESYSKSYWSDVADTALALPSKTKEKAEDYTEYALESYSKTSFSSGVDKTLDAVKPISDAAAKYMGYFANPENVQNMLDTLKWLVIGGAVIYALVLIGPTLKAFVGAW